MECIVTLTIQANTAPRNHFVLSSVRNMITESYAWMVFNSLHLVTAYLHLRPCEALLIPQHAKLWMPQHHSTFCSLFPGMPFPSFVHGKLQFILQHAHHKSQPGCCFFFLHILGIAQHSIITLPSNYPYYISLMPFECLI